jgi:predicted Zn-dependent protease
MLEDRDLLFYKGLHLLAKELESAAFECFYAACPFDEPVNPKILSYYGFCLAKTHTRIDEGLKICHDALALDPKDPELYCNLAKVFLLRGNKNWAIKILYRGLKNTKQDIHSAEILELLTEFVKRRSPPFKSLPRNHFLNKYSGKFAYARAQRILASEQKLSDKCARFSDYFFLPIDHFFVKFRLRLE